MSNHYDSCVLCPRACGVNRNAGEIGFCGETSVLRIGAAVIHKGEEPPLVGTGGSGTIFISGCNLGCVFCQNYQISHHAAVFPAREEQNNDQITNGKKQLTMSLGKAVSGEDFARICTALRDMGAENINIVTGSHAVPAVIKGLAAMRKAGVQLPVLWNSSGYETSETLELLKDHVDIYLPDLKTLDAGIAEKFFNAPDYPAIAKTAVLKMIDNVNERAAQRTADRIIIRHLILPGYLESTRRVLRWFADNAKGIALLSLMTQYTPIPNRGLTLTAPQRYLSQEEYDTVMGWLEEFEIEDGFCQELVTGSDWLPDFRRANPFPSKLSVPVWNLYQ